MTSTLFTSSSSATEVDPPKVTARRFYRPELDALRFFAFMAVFIFHSTSSIAPLLSNCGGFGLSLFFLLSAFLITELLQREIEKTGTIDIRSFFIRRALRIWPLYYGFLLLAIFIGYVSPLRQAPWHYHLSYFLMVGNIYFGRHDISYAPSLYLWSISVEEQFYLFWPFFNKIFNRRNLMLVAAAAFPIAALATYVIMLHPPRSQETVWTSSFVEFQVFAGGVLLSLGLKGRVPKLSKTLRICLLIFGLAIWFVVGNYSGVIHHYRGILGLLVGYPALCVGCVALFLAVYGINSAHVPRVLVYLGKISFGLYVFHKIALESAGALVQRVPRLAASHVAAGLAHLSVALLLTVALAALSYHFYELPFLKLKDRFAVVPSRKA